MQKYPYQIAWLCIINFLLTACASNCASEADMGSPVMRRATCSTLNNQVVFNPTTSNTRNADIEMAEGYLEAYDFDVLCQNCETKIID